MASKLMQRMKKNSSISGANELSSSKYYDGSFFIDLPTDIPMLNVAHSGRPDKGMQAGILTIAGDSRMFKTGFMLEELKAFQNKYPDGVCLFYDSEFGAPISYFKSRGINMDNVLHCPIEYVEELKHDIAKQLKDLEEGDKIFIMVDSIGGLASRKEIEDAEKSDACPADFTRAKALNSLFRVVTPKLNKYNINMVVINHYYETMEMFSKKIISGGKKSFLASDDVWIITRSKTDSGAEGFNFNIHIEKSRKCKEKSTFSIECTFEHGINKWSMIYKEASELGYLNAAGPWIKVINFDTGEIENRKKSDIMADNEWFERLVKDEKFIKHLSDKYLLVKD